MTNKRAVIYARVSTDDQAEHGYSLQSQVEACRDYAARHEMAVIGRFQDDYSGAELDRPGLGNVRKLIDQRQVDAVIVYASDRLTRNLAHLLLLRDQMASADVELHYCNRGLSHNTPEGQMTENIEGVFNEYWRAKIREGSMRGRNTKAGNGHCVLGGRPPFGYRVEDGQAAVYEPEACTVRQIFAWYTFGDDTLPPLSLMEITRRLNDGGPQPQRGGQWCPTTVLHLLKREQYAGVSYYGKTRKAKRADGKKVNVKQPPERWVRIETPGLAVIDADTYQAAQRRIGDNKREAARNTRRDYLLRGRLRCGRCGRAMSSISSRHTSHGQRRAVEVYRCNNASRMSNAAPICGASVTAAKLDGPAWRWVVELIDDDENLERGLRDMRQRAESELEPKRERLAALSSLLERAERKVQKLIATFAEDDDADDIAQAAVKTQIRAIGKEREALAAERDQLTAELAAGTVTDAEWASIRHTARAVKARTANATPEQMRLLVEALDLRATLRDGDGGRWLDLTCALPADTQIELATKIGHVLKQPRRVVFAGSLPIDGQPPAPSLADALFSTVKQGNVVVK